MAWSQHSDAIPPEHKGPYLQVLNHSIEIQLKGPVVEVAVRLDIQAGVSEYRPVVRPRGVGNVNGL